MRREDNKSLYLVLPHSKYVDKLNEQILASCSPFANREQNYIFTFMKAHNGMRLHDVVVLLKLLLMEHTPWQYRELSFYLFISVSEIAESLNRSHIAGLVDESKRKVYRQSLMEFIIYGLHYVFPQQPGPMVTGTPTTHSTLSIRLIFLPIWNMCGQMKMAI